MSNDKQFDRRVSDFRLVNVEEKIKFISEDIRELYARVETIGRENIVITTQYDQIIKTLEEMKVDIKSLKEKPEKNWNLVTNTIISVIVTGVGMMVLNIILHSHNAILK